MSDERVYRMYLIDADRAGVQGHPEQVIRRIAPHAHEIVPQSICDAWFFKSPRLINPPSFVEDVTELWVE